MFQNSYQNGAYFQIFDPKLPQDKTKNLYKMQNVSANNKIFDKDLKTYVYDFNAPSAKIAFPKQDRKDLYLIQEFLNFQIFFYPSEPWSIELFISDLNKTKRRIILSPKVKLETKPFFIKYPCSHVQEGVWTNLTISLYNFILAFKGQTYRSLDIININGHFKLRRIFTTQQPIIVTNQNQQAKSVNLLPKIFYFPTQLPISNCMVNYEESSIIIEDIYEPTEPSTKNNKSNVMSRQLISTPKTEIIRPDKKGLKDDKKFLADTGGPQKNRKKLEKNISTQQKSQQTRLSDKLALSNDKKIVKRHNVGRSELPKQRSSIQKKKNPKQEQRLKNKLNPWRSGKKNQSQTDGSQLSQTKPNIERKTESAETTLFKTKNNLVSKFNESNNKGFQHRSDHFSDSQYIEMSQKFSTLTEGRFFKNQLASQHVEAIHKDPDEIEQNIELQSNQMCESNRKNQQALNILVGLKNQDIQQSISDSLNHIKKQSYNMNKQKGKSKIINRPPLPNTYQNSTNSKMMTSYYGFGEKIMNKYMQEVERPYSPPIGEKQLTEQMSEQNDNQNEKEVQLIYDPVLNCYYDHKTHTYYELKN